MYGTEWFGYLWIAENDILKETPYARNEHGRDAVEKDIWTVAGNVSVELAQDRDGETERIASGSWGPRWTVMLK